MLESGKLEENLSRRVWAAERRLPDSVQNAPQLVHEGMQLYFDALFALESERPQGFGVAKVPWSAIRYYAREYGFSGNELERFHIIFNVLDSAYVDHYRKKEEAERAKANKTPKHKPFRK